MDLSVKQEVIRAQQKYETEYGSHAFKLQEAFKETDITGNNNFFNSLKTETSSDHARDPSPPFQVSCSEDKDLEVDNSLFSYPSFKKAMDLTIHNRTVDGGKRTIFDDAEYFARNCCYKLLPITFEQVDETIIHTEHNYSLFSLDSGSESDEDCSRTMDYSQIREKNYKKRRTKCRGSGEQEEVDVQDTCGESSPVESLPGDGLRPQQQQQEQSLSPNSVEQESAFLGQPLDLSAAPAVQEEKTEPLGSIGEESGQLDSDKENVGSEVGGGVGGIRVTITRPDEKENYQPCDLFLNDIARLVPWLIDKDCFEVDILDRTCEREEFRKHRLYYVIAESTWRSFQSTNERVILTNDQSLVQPLGRVEKGERPSYLVFDQFSLAKCLAEYCQEIGGCFEYTCVEEGAERASVEDKSTVEMREAAGEEVVGAEEEARVAAEVEEDVKAERNKRKVGKEAEKEEEKEEAEKEEEKEEAGKVGEKDEVEQEEKEKEKKEVEKEKGQKSGKESERRRVGEEAGEGAKGMKEEEEEEEGRKAEVAEGQEVTVEVGTEVEAGAEEVPEDVGIVREKKPGKGKGAPQKFGLRKQEVEAVEAAAEVVVGLPRAERQGTAPVAGEATEHSEEVPASAVPVEKVPEAKGRKARTRGSKRRKKPPMQPEPKNSRITTRSKSTSEFETSQKSDKRVSTKEGRKRRDPTPARQEPPSKRKKTPKPEDAARSRRSAPPPQRPEANTEKTAGRKRPERKENGKQMEAGKGRREEEKRVEGRGNVQAVGRSLRSGATTAPNAGRPVPSRKVRRK